MAEVRVTSGRARMHNIAFRGFFVSITEELRLSEEQETRGKPTNYSSAG